MRGFTLVEMMITIAIGAILLAISAGAYSSIRNDSLVTSASEKTTTALYQARLRALSQRNSQSVTIDYSNEGMTDSLGNSHLYDSVNLQNLPSGTCIPGVSASEAITFKSRGAATAAIIKVSSSASSKTNYIVVNGITGGVHLYKSCTGLGILS